MDHPAANESLQKETIALQRQQTDLQRQQNRIVELLAHNQNRSKLPQRGRVTWTFPLDDATKQKTGHNPSRDFTTH